MRVYPVPLLSLLAAGCAASPAADAPPVRLPIGVVDDPLPAGALLRLGTSRLRHAIGVTAVAFSADGTRVVSGDASGGLECWDAATGRGLWRATAQGGQVRGVACDPAGRVVCTIGEDRVVAARDLATGAPRWSLPALERSGYYDRQPVAFLADGSRVAWGGLDEAVRVLRVEDGSEEASYQTGGATALVFSADGGALFAGSHDTAITVIDRASGKVVATLLAEGPRGSGFGVTHLALSPDGTRLAAGYQDGTVRLWDVAASKSVDSWPRSGNGAVLAVGFSQDAATPLAAYADGMITDLSRVRQEADGGPPILGTGSASWRFDGGLAEAAAFDPRSGRLALGLRSGRVVVIGARGMGVLADEGHDGAVIALATSPDGRRVASGGRDGQVLLWDASTGEWEGTFYPGEGPVYAVAFSADSSEIAFGGWDRTLRRRSVGPDREDPPDESRAGAVVSLSYDAAGALLVTEADFRAGPALPAIALPEQETGIEITSAALSPDGGTLWVGRSDGTVLAFPAPGRVAGTIPR